MNPILRWAAVAVVAAVGLGAAVLALGTGGPLGPGAKPTPAPIATGDYAVDLPVAGILAKVDGATNLTASERLAIKRDILVIEGATTLNLRISITADAFDLRYGTDGGPLLPSAPWHIAVNDGREMAFTNIPSGESSARYEVVRSADGSGFRLRALTSASAVETLVREILFDTADYLPID